MRRTTYLQHNKWQGFRAPRHPARPWFRRPRRHRRRGSSHRRGGRGRGGQERAPDCQHREPPGCPATRGPIPRRQAADPGRRAAGLVRYVGVPGTVDWCGLFLNTDGLPPQMTAELGVQVPLLVGAPRIITPRYFSMVSINYSDSSTTHHHPTHPTTTAPPPRASSSSGSGRTWWTCS